MNFVARELLVIGVLAVVAVLLAGALFPQDDNPDTPSFDRPPAADVQESELTPAGGGELRIITATPAVTQEMPTATSTLVPNSTANTQPPGGSPTPMPPQQPRSAPSADFSGRWRIVDTISEGAGTGQTFTFDVTLQQNGNSLSGGNSGIVITGTVQDQTAVLTYSQAALGHMGTFNWTLTGPNTARGTFTSSVPNSGTSTLQRLP